MKFNQYKLPLIKVFPDLGENDHSYIRDSPCKLSFTIILVKIKLEELRNKLENLPNIVANLIHLGAFICFDSKNEESPSLFQGSCILMIKRRVKKDSMNPFLYAEIDKINSCG